MKLKLIDKVQESADAVRFVFESPIGTTWIAGQYLHYTLPHENVDERNNDRYFTIASAPFEKNIFIVTRIFEKLSSFKNHLNNLNIGDEIEAEGPEGDFIVDDPTREFVFVAGGIGITPFRSILLDLDHKGVNLNAILLYGNSDENFVFKEELEALTKKHPNFKIQYFISPKRIEKSDIEEAMSRLNDPIVYVSGPEVMVESFEKVLNEIGLDESHQKRDYFPGYEPI